MIRNFENNIVLTSQNPEAFLVFKADGSTGVIDPSLNLNYVDLYINGWDATTINDADSAQLTLNATNIATFHLFTDSVEDFDYNLVFDVSLTGISSYTIDVSIFNRPFLLDTNEFNTFNTQKSLVDNEASYLLLRTNPKYSGNIKLMIDASNNIFLDTFKVSNILSNKKYRKQSVSGNSFLSGDIRRVFKTLPQGEIFKLDDEDTLDISNPKTEYSDQYNVKYNYGAKFLEDELYDNNYSILAPLWMNSKIPDYFAIFRLDGTYNDETYETTVDLSNLAYKFITNGNLIKNWDLKSNAPIGNYLNNHLTELLKVESPVNLSLNEYDPNTWVGIAVDKGIITGRSEIPYFFQKIAHDFTDVNAFVSQGFERNNLLCPNLLNIEFMFNDADVSLYSMHRYFGLYLTENELYKFAYYSNESDSSIRIISLDENNVLEFADSSIFDPSSGDVDSDYENRLFIRNDGVDLERITNINQFDGSRGTIGKYTNKLGENIFNTEVREKFLNPFITLKINNLLKQGEHLRIINKTENKIWEVYGTESEILNPGEAGPYVSFTEPSISYPNLYRTTFSILGEISDQATAIQSAFSMFADYEEAPFSVGFEKNNGLSLIINSSSDNDNYVFQRLTGQISFPVGEASGTFNSSGNPADIKFFDVITPDASDFNRISYDASYGPIDFELYGDRMSLIINLIDVSQYHVYAYDASVSELFSDNVLYDTSCGWNKLIQDFDISTGIEYTSQYVENPVSNLNSAIVITEDSINLGGDNVWWGYDVYPISVSLMGINPVKDIDYTVYDSSTSGMNFKSDYWYAHDNDASTYTNDISIGHETITARNSYEIIQGEGAVLIDGSSLAYDATEGHAHTYFTFNTFFGSADVSATTSTILKYNILDGSHNYTSYDASISEENINDYYTDDYYLDGSDNQHLLKTKLKHGLTIPTVSKWGTNGQDVRNNNIRLNLTGDFFTDGSTITNSNFIPYDDSSLYGDEISYPIFKYMYTGNDAWKDYVFYDINDVVLDGSTRTTVRNLIFETPYSDVFSKLLYNNNNNNNNNNDDVYGNVSRSSILYYNLYENQVIGIINGLKLGLKVKAIGEKTLNVTNWDRYRFSLITSPTINLNHNYPIEVIINENTKTILIIWYQGNDVLNYTYKWSSFLPGKSNLINQHTFDVDKKYQAFKTGVNDSSCSFIKSPFIVNTNSAVNSIINMYDTSSYYDSSICVPFSQLSYSIFQKINTEFNANSLVQDDNKVTDDNFIFTQSYDTFLQNNVNYTYIPSTISYGTNISNIASTYLNNYNFYDKNTCNIETFKYIVNDNNIQYYIIQGDSIISSQEFNTPPIEINLFDPIEYKAPSSDASIYTFNGSYNPIFKNILLFNDNETDNLINTVEKDFVFANTDLQSYENIYQYWFNRVVSTVASSDTSNNILFTKNFNPFKSLWDGDYFVLSSGATDTSIDGYNSSLELSSFFGSKLIAFPNELILELWNASNSKVTEGVDYWELEFNLSKSIVDLFTQNITFLNSWNGLTSVTDNLINRYIIKTVLNYYNISINKINPTIYDKVYDGTILHQTYNNNFKNELINIDSKLSLINNEYIYKIKFNKSNNRSYFVKFSFNKK